MFLTLIIVDPSYVHIVHIFTLEEIILQLDVKRNRIDMKIGLCDITAGFDVQTTREPFVYK